MDPPICKECDYDLTGLKRLGRCPECGNFYNMNSSSGIKAPLTEQQKLDTLVARIRTIVLAVLATLVVLGAVGLGALMGELKPIVVGLFMALVVGVAAVVSYVYERPE